MRIAYFRSIKSNLLQKSCVTLNIDNIRRTYSYFFSCILILLILRSKVPTQKCTTILLIVGTNHILYFIFILILVDLYIIFILLKLYNQVAQPRQTLCHYLLQIIKEQLYKIDKQEYILLDIIIVEVMLFVIP